MKLLYTLLIVLGAAVVAAIGFAYSGIHNVSAMAPHSGVVAWLLSTTSQASIARRASGIRPPELSDDRRLVSGAGDFDAMCAGCHGAPGRDPGPVGQGLNPPPPDLAEQANDMTPAQLFWVTKHGIRMTGMPAWGATHGDDELWSVVAFLRELPVMDADRYRALVSQARQQGMGHHGDDTAAEQSDDVTHDHSTHDH